MNHVNFYPVRYNPFVYVRSHYFSFGTIFTTIQCVWSNTVKTRLDGVTMSSMIQNVDDVLLYGVTKGRGLDFYPNIVDLLR